MILLWNSLVGKVEIQPEIELKYEMIRFISRTSASCFVGIDLSDEFFDTLMEFNEKLNRIVVSTYVVPRSILRWIPQQISFAIERTRDHIPKQRSSIILVID